jgi:hypothetical protein
VSKDLESSFNWQKFQGKFVICIKVFKNKFAMCIYSPTTQLVTGWMAGVQIAARVRFFSLLHNVQTSSEAYPVSYPVSTGASFPGGKAVWA